MELLIEELEDVIFPSIDSWIDEIVSIVRPFAHWWINFQEMRPAELLEFLSHDFAGNGRVIVCGMDEHDGAIRLAHGSQQALAEFEGVFPRCGRRAESDRGSHAAVSLGRK
jgi:hypothetical protein